MKTLVFIALTTLFALAISQPFCGQDVQIKVRGDNYLTAYLVHQGVQGSANVLSQSPDSLQWKNVYTTNFNNVQNGDIIRIAVKNAGSVGAFKGALTFENGYEVFTQAGSSEFFINCALSTNLTGCPNVFQATHNAALNIYGSDTLPDEAKWVWSQADGFNPATGILVFDFPVCCVEEPIVQTTPECSYEYWEFLALGYPWYHRADLDAWCGAFPSVAGKVTNCYNGAQQIAAACFEGYPDFDNIVAGDGSVDWNKRCFLNCQ